MKKPLLILFLLSILQSASAQQPDSVTLNMLRIQNARLDTIQLNLQRFSDNYKSGNVAIVGGFLFAVFSGIIYLANPTSTDDKGVTTTNKAGLYGIGVGVISISFGQVIHMDAHKWIRKAARIKRK